MSRPLPGVNLGGWLVLEPWLTPSLFKGSQAVDEYSFCQTGDMAQLRKHYQTFITEADFAWLAEQGIEAVRLPVGYWLFGDVTPYLKTVQHVDKAFGWAQKHGLKILLDLHGAAGSQNGEMHSGHAGAIAWATQANIDQTLTVLTRIAGRYGQHPALLGISFLNEPSPHITRSVLLRFYETAALQLQPLCKPDTWLVFSDGFRPGRWRRVLPNLFIDYHHYQIFSWLDKLLPARVQLWRAACTMPYKVRRMTQRHQVVIGEWSLALRSEKMSRLSRAEQQRLTRRYAMLQLQAFAGTAAWFYWTYKTERPNAWSFRHCVQHGVLML